MATLIPGKRIKSGTILLNHFGDFKIPENRLLLNYPSHTHSNKNIIDRIRYSGATEIIDLGVFEGILLEVIAARRDGLNLGGTIDTKADKTFVQSIVDEISQAKGENESLYDAIRVNGIMIDDKLNAHIGNTPHSTIDAMYADYTAAKQGHNSLLEVIQGLSTIDPNGDIIVNQLRPWTTEYVVTEPGRRLFMVPHTYATESNSIEVFEGPLRMMVNDDFIEKTNDSIEFTYDVPVGSRVRITGVNAGMLYEWAQYYISTAGQKSFQTINSYQIGRDEAIVYESGLLMRKGIDYLESNSNTITFTNDLPAGVKVTILKRR